MFLVHISLSEERDVKTVNAIKKIVQAIDAKLNHVRTKVPHEHMPFQHAFLLI